MEEKKDFKSKLKDFLSKVKELSKKAGRSIKYGYLKFYHFFKVKSNLNTGIILVGLPIVITLVIEMISRASFLEGFKFLFEHPMPFLVNACIIECTVMIALLFKRRALVYLIVSAFWLAMGIVNRNILDARVTPFNGTDIFMIKTGLRIADKYYSPFTIILAIIGALAIIAFLVFVWFKGPKIQTKIKRFRNGIVLAGMVVATLIVTSIAIDTNLIASSFNNLPNAYDDYGFTYCFLNSIFDNGVKKPSNYSETEVVNLIDDTNKEPGISQVTDKTPNIIFIQLESFFDITRMSNLKFSEDPIPYFRELMNDYNGGFLSVPSIGAGTSNTEFEVLTGMNLEDFGASEIPFKGILLDKTCESIAYDLSANGYLAQAIHNNDGTFYQRHTVYPNLGFDTFTSMEYMQLEESDYTPSKWVRDEILTRYIGDCLDYTPDGVDFVFTVSVEGHGRYPNEFKPELSNIRVVDAETNEPNYPAQFYVNLIHDMDQTFIKPLIEMLNNRSEETILVLYGDHLPSLGLNQEYMTDGTLMQTEYVVWNNMDLDLDFGDIETYQLLPKVLGALGIKTGVINTYHQTHINDEPMEYLSGLQNLEYDMLYGGNLAFSGTNPYLTKDIKFGLKDPVIESVYMTTEDGVNYVNVKGKNFTKWSMININDSYHKTELIDFETIRCKNETLLPQDKIFIAQVGDDKYQLSQTEIFIYQ